ncbi:DNA translocase FtsK [Flavihumibacter petaseus]|uniref:FtsK/SpoIIIE family protein n=1 Tax=Flavihumibacter petaseus NBRC 106054 TaxID=1220578 RepID=A0A0E9N1V4_9BACT|nr:DNA translocase FtsK [Flavihumibacter petaseus]GAO43758.1 FtsK/SpoIIIE family protein [Flavihumibacter petaseus NBRC 106054]
MSHKYRDLEPEEQEELFSNYLMDSWSYSKVTSFARNEKGFEMNHIFGLYGKKSATSVAGNAYHTALQYFFETIRDKKGLLLDVVELEACAFQYIDGVSANVWKLGKTTQTVEECQKKASSVASTLLRNFIVEVGVYLDDMQEILDVEVSIDEFLTINGVDIPLPCHGKIDLVILTTEGKTVIVDHKSKTSYTDDDEIALSIGTQAITYVTSYEARSGRTIDEVWFVENKSSVNKDKSAQLRKFKVEMDLNTRRLYEALLYEPLKRMLEAISNPDYIYLINEADNYVDRAEMYDFWCRTMICEVEDFNVEESKKDLVARRLKRIKDSSLTIVTPNIIKKFKENASAFIQYDLSNKNMTQAEKIEHVMRSFGTAIRVAHMFEGYSSNTYLLEVSAGVKLASIQSHRLDIANALDVSSVRISKDLVVHEGKSYLAVDFVKKRDRDLFFDRSALVGRRIPLGKDNFDNVVAWDLDNSSTPHMLVCGATGSGKSVFVKSILEYGHLAGVKEIVVFDPKFEFTDYNHRRNVKVYNDIEDIEKAMEKLVEDMQGRVKTGQNRSTLVIFDEFADALANSAKAKDLRIYEEIVTINAKGVPIKHREHVGDRKPLEENLRILLQKGRSSGFRIVAATQRASVKVITGDAKVNFPVQVCFRVPKEADSRVVLDESGAESLAGSGDGLIKSPEYKDTVRFQAYYVKPSEITAVSDTGEEIIVVE